MIKFISGVSETILAAGYDVKFSTAFEGSALVSEILPRDGGPPVTKRSSNTMPLIKATSRKQGRAVGANLVTSLEG